MIELLNEWQEALLVFDGIDASPFLLLEVT